MGSKPNVILIMTDQHRADQSAREGFPLDTMPFLDSFAREGTWFDRAYTANPTCLPARVSMLTGRWPSSTGFRHNSLRPDPTNTPQVPVYTQDVFDVMRERGYRTSLCGKNHSHLTPDRVDYWSAYGHSAGYGRTDTTEQEKEFDEYIQALHHRADMSPAPFPLECQGPYRAVRDAIDWIDSSDSPFFLWLSFAEPHNPYQVPEPYFDMFPPESLPPVRTTRDEWKNRGFKYEFTRWMGLTGFPDYDEQYDRARSNYLGMLRLIDDQVERLIDHLRDAGQLDNTIVVFVSDHGDFVGEYGLMRKGPEMPDCLMRIPFVWHGPGIVRDPSPHTAHVSLLDVFPTICEAIGAEIPTGVQGRSLWPLLTGAQYPEAEFESVYAEQGMGGLHYTDGDEIIAPTDDGLLPGVSFDCLNSRTQSGAMRTLRKGDWKLDFDMQGRGQLYNLAEDPAEIHNLYGSQKTADVERELLADLLAWSLRAQDVLPEPNIRYKLKTDPRNYWAPYRQ
jgi:arylsulfatase A-like enzyme